MKKRVLLCTTTDVSALVAATQELSCDVLAVSDPEERYRVDAKSILGLYSLDLSTPIELRWETDNEEKEKQFLDRISKFVKNAEEWDYDYACEHLS